MARIALQIEDPALRLTLEVMLKVEGHVIGNDQPDVTLSDTVAKAVAAAEHGPSLLLAALSSVPKAIAAMRQGVYGYILTPLQPGEAPLMVERAVADAQRNPALLPGEPASLSEDEDLSLEAAEWRHIQSVLKRCRGNQVKAARLLGIGRNTLWRKLRSHARPADNG